MATQRHVARTTRCGAPDGSRAGVEAAQRSDSDSQRIHDLLEALDDAMFTAIAGNETSFDRARELWREALGCVGPELIEESREQYLRFASEVTRHDDGGEARDPAMAIVALEVIELLSRRA